MDIHDCLGKARTLVLGGIDDKTNEEINSLMDAYVDWRISGGYEPMFKMVKGSHYHVEVGDELFGSISARYAKLTGNHTPYWKYCYLRENRENIAHIKVYGISSKD